MYMLLKNFYKKMIIKNSNFSSRENVFTNVSRAFYSYAIFSAKFDFYCFNWVEGCVFMVVVIICDFFLISFFKTKIAPAILRSAKEIKVIIFMLFF